jgi:hypothetical protein
MRTQYHFRRSPNGLCAWDVHRLIEKTRSLTPERIPLSVIHELDEPHWANERIEHLTCREIVEHTRLILDCNLTYPIILSSKELPVLRRLAMQPWVRWGQVRSPVVWLVV